MLFRTVIIGAVFIPLWCSSLAQAECRVEAKILLSPEQVKTAVASLNAAKETDGQVYFFDTGALDLLSQGVIVRLRQGPSPDLTVKLRLRESNELGAKEFSVPTGGHEKFKCEVDVVGGKEQKSYSIQNKVAAQKVPETGAEILRMLSADQKELLKQARVTIDWRLVKRIAGIESRSWRVKAQPPFTPMVLELWQWPTGQVLELSARARADTGVSLYSQVKRLATSKGISLAVKQEFKTTMVLNSVAGAVR